ncbi:MAG: ABC transporter substrate-binding protein [Candidatus Dormibacteria bacterium]
MKLVHSGILPIVLVTLLSVGASAAYVTPRIQEVTHHQMVSQAHLTTGSDTASSSTTTTQSGGGGGSAAAVPPGLQCARGANGGATDVGVTGSEIRLASTTAESGVAGSFLGPVRKAMEAVKNVVNRAGGVCGRTLTLDLRDDAWNAERGQSFIQNFISEGYFALAVVPSSQGLDAAVGTSAASSVIDNAPDPMFPDQKGIPVVGSDGMLVSQYKDPWVWPVATSTASTMHIIAKNAYDRGARHVGLVYETTYKFGPEGAAAFKGAISRLPGMQMLAEKGIESGLGDYGSAATDFNNQCNASPGCDFVALLMEPETAQQWIQDGGMTLTPRLGYAGPQPLFTNSFAKQCGGTCNGMQIWTGFSPPTAPFSTDPGVQQYASDIQDYDSNADVNNEFLEGGYLGMDLLVRALQETGPYLTRARLRQVLDRMTLDTGLSSPLSWHPGNHYANVWSHSFAINFTQAFTGFQYMQTGWVQDPWVGQDGP